MTDASSTGLSDDQIMRGIMELLGCSLSECEALSPMLLAMYTDEVLAAHAQKVNQ